MPYKWLLICPPKASLKHAPTLLLVMDGELLLIQWTIPVYLPQPALLRAVTLRCKRCAGGSVVTMGQGGKSLGLWISWYRTLASERQLLRMGKFWCVCVIQLHPSGKFSLESWCSGGDCIFFVQQETATWRIMVPRVHGNAKCCQILKWRRFYLNKMDFLLHLKNHIGHHWTCNVNLGENRGVSAPLAQFHLTHLPALVL